MEDSRGVDPSRAGSGLGLEAGQVTRARLTLSWPSCGTPGCSGLVMKRFDLRLLCVPATTLYHLSICSKVMGRVLGVTYGARSRTSPIWVELTRL
eukprot:7021730-Pyramimonas_sp.AAC.1